MLPLLPTLRRRVSHAEGRLRHQRFLPAGERLRDRHLFITWGPVPVWHPVAPGRRAWMAPSGNHWDRRVGDRHLRFINVSLQHHHFGPREDPDRWKHRTL